MRIRANRPAGKNNSNHSNLLLLALLVSERIAQLDTVTNDVLFFSLKSVHFIRVLSFGILR